MKTIEFRDVDGQKVVVQMSSLATQEAFRIYVYPREGEIENGEREACLHLNRNQAEILIGGLKDLFED